MNIRYLSFFLLSVALFLGVAGCESQQQVEVSQLKKEVLRIHDLAMAKMGPMHELSTALQKRVDTACESCPQQKATDTILQLEEAHENMMAWMHQYQEPDTAVPLVDQRQYYMEQKEKILAVRDEMVSAMATAEQLLEAP